MLNPCGFLLAILLSLKLRFSQGSASWQAPVCSSWVWINRPLWFWKQVMEVSINNINNDNDNNTQQQHQQQQQLMREGQQAAGTNFGHWGTSACALFARRAGLITVQNQCVLFNVDWCEHSCELPDFINLCDHCICLLRNIMVARTVLLLAISALGVVWFLEQPLSSLLEFHPRFQWLMTKFRVFKCFVWIGSYPGSGSPKPSWKPGWLIHY